MEATHIASEIFRPIFSNCTLTVVERTNHAHLGLPRKSPRLENSVIIVPMVSICSSHHLITTDGLRDH